MKPDKIKSSTQKTANILIIALVVLGTIAFMSVNQVADATEGMSKLFLIFFGAIITIQVIPGMMLLGAMLKGVFSLGRKSEALSDTTRRK